MPKLKFLLGSVVFVFASLFFFHKIFASNSVNIWWPTNNASVSGVQPFKAVLDGTAASDYKMFWSVDNGQWNYMDTNNTDYPHKEVSVDLSGWHWKGNGPYNLTFIAQSNDGHVIAEQSVSITIPQTGTVASPTPTPAPSSSPTPTPTPAASATPAPSSTPTPTTSSTPAPSIAPVTASGDLYVEPDAKNITSDSYLQTKIESQPQAKWFGGWNSNVQSDVANYVSNASATGKIPVIVAYNIPFRDCGGYSAGGATSEGAYNSWIGALANGLNGSRAMVILEPDGLASIDCLSGSDQAARYSMLSSAVSTLKSHGARVYLDAGHPWWHDAGTMASRLSQANVGAADGFALNVSNFVDTSNNVSYGSDISSHLGGKHFVVDTGRNGNGAPANGEWCNPAGMALGNKPTLSTGNPLVDGFLWIKRPGESDGNCNGGPSAGVWWQDYAYGLATRASW